ncbi:pyranose dehydrogenase 3 [Parachaetomium inaequale]|uniref:Pyranose dehydrogenase 3 n=1 Tax=Parachaetomium inaequale TaxID=2588326 RepID=A0AAN6PGS2_9PEZI|nr:pyranose dehydrogenase 3 [Parachaetomium inaequale]
MRPFILPSLLLAAGAAGAAAIEESHAQEYDYIIVGGGTAGLALATRLSQGLKKASILVIEAGPAALHEDGINIPGLKGSTLGGKYDWNFTTVPQTHLNNRTIFTPRGRVLGGTSALNLLTWDRAAAAEFDAWEAVGNPGWNWRTMSAAMEKAETYVGGPAGSGSSGPIHAVINRVIPLHQGSFIPAVSRNFPIPPNPDSLQGNPIGVMYQPENINPASYNRSYSATAYLPLAGPNLAVLTNSPVTKINFAPSNNPNQNGKGNNKPLLRATSVTLTNNTTLHATHEIILACGALSTPHLLELSGIGHPPLLRAAGISPVLINLPGVGENYQDHLRVQVSYQLRDGLGFVTGDMLATNATFAAEEWAKRLRGEAGFYDDTGAGYVFADWGRVVGAARGEGLVRLAEGLKGGGDVGSRKKVEMLRDRTVPQVEVIFSDGYTGVKGYPPVGSGLYGKGFFSLVAGLMHPLSRGSVHVDPRDPLGKPVVDPRFVDNEYDMEGLVEILKFCRRIARAEPLRSVWVAEYEPGEELVQTDEDWREYVRNTTLTVFHPMGTAAMLPRKDGGVVDSRLMVYGTANLRVVDASIIPVQISAHPQTAVYGIAEKAAEIIIAAHR